MRLRHIYTAMNVAWIAAASESFGVRRSTLSLAKGLRDRGCTVTIFILGPNAATDDYREHGMQVVQTSLSEAPWVRRSGLMGNVRQFLALRDYERQSVKPLLDAAGCRRFDVVHYQSQNLTGVAGRFARARKMPCTWHMPNAIGSKYPLGINKIIYQLQCRRYGILPLANSAYTATTLGATFVKPEVMHYGIDPERFSPDKVESITRQSAGLPDDAIVFGIFARLIWHKGQKEFLEALASIQHPPAPLHLAVLGGPVDGDYARELRELAVKLHFSDQLHMLGEASQPERYYKMIDVGVNSRVDPEPFGISVIESLMLERPVLAHAAGGPKFTIVDGVTGWHVPDASVASFAQGITRALEDRPRWVQMGREARRQALESYTVDAMAENYLGILRRRLGLGADKSMTASAR